MRPVLKDIAWERVDDELRIVYDVREQLLLADPDGSVERLLGLLSEGGRTVAELAAALSLPVADVAAAVSAFDEYRLVEDGDRLGRLPDAVPGRYDSNLAFFESFSTLGRGREDLQRDLTDAHVLVLGTGGMGASTIQHLCGLGVGRLTLLDRDEVEARNFARQYLYRWSDIGTSKVKRAAEWVREFDPAITVAAVEAGITGADDLGALLDDLRPDVVASGVDSPVEIDRWVNAACVSRGVPYVRSGILVTQGRVWSVDPGRSACLDCVVWDLDAADPIEATDPDSGALAAERAAARLFSSKAGVNRAVGPVAGFLGAMAAFEVLRFLTSFEPPTYAGRPAIVDFAAGCTTHQVEWRRDPTCATCGSTSPAGAAAPDPAMPDLSTQDSGGEGR